MPRLNSQNCKHLRILISLVLALGALHLFMKPPVTQAKDIFKESLQKLDVTIYKQGKKIAVQSVTQSYQTASPELITFNDATYSELTACKYISPAIADQIIKERKKRPFDDWDDFSKRIKGMGKEKISYYKTIGLKINREQKLETP
ncbi:MAG: hypothetical protein GX221_06760 [Candidatus Riflebacteria bacterium]|nr:hypothetical protein [Candidatus Riflebacteria bacterium]